MNICFELFKLETFEYLAMSPEFQFYPSSQSNILLKERFFKKTSKHVCERASIVVERLENFLPLSMTSVVIFGEVKKKLSTEQ